MKREWSIDEDRVEQYTPLAVKMLQRRHMTRDGFFEAMVPCNPGETQVIIDRLGIKTYNIGRIRYVSLP